MADADPTEPQLAHSEQTLRHTLVTNCLQTVAHRKQREFDRPATPSPFTYQVREQMLATSMDNAPRTHRRKTRSVQLRSLPLTQPATKIGQVTWAWAEIEASLVVGMRLKEVWEAAGRDG